MKKKSKRSLIKQMDKIWSQIIRNRERCARCSRPDTLQAAHIFSRRNMSVRWDLDNGMPLCYACHMFWAHKEPVYFSDFAKDYLGDLKFQNLKTRAGQVKKWSVIELEDMIETYKQALKDLKGGER